MFHLKLTKSCSYTGVIHATAERPDVFLENAATAQLAIATGYFELLPDGDGLLSSLVAPVLDTMNVNQLRAYIKKNKLAIDLPLGTGALELREAVIAAECEDDGAAQCIAGGNLDAEQDSRDAPLPLAVQTGD